MTTVQLLITAVDGLANSIEFFTEVALVISLFAIVIKNERDSIYFISALFTLFIGISMASSHSAISYSMIFLSVYEFMKGIEIVFEIDLPSRGWSFVKGVYQKAKGRD